jgi:outer membrane biosynthesis protein TonB
VQDILKESGYVAPDGVELESFWIGPPPDDSKSAFEWAGEWTVTYETFRDMGAAFAVALVLIYILVVWEFGNFRIPALIRAPIPLTLLGIIPAHFIFFQMGWGGEFTATSMIGWIALAGIIVRNSILLVDFSIHQVQQGTPVVEAVIMACTTRTRPIMITAFALVCGSSVIFFDPIFQGMAISLASGVLVSTVLTLIVIPLGCIAASKDLLEVAAATAPEGSQLPSIEEYQVQRVEKPVEKVSVSGEKKPSFIHSVWLKLVTLVSMIFYLLRGLVLLFLQLFKRKKRDGEEASSNESGSSGGGSGGGGSKTQSPAPATSQDKETESIAAAPASAEKVETPAPPEIAPDPEVPEETPAAAESVEPAEAEVAENQPETERVEATKSEAEEKQAPKTKRRPSTLNRQTAKKKKAVAAMSQAKTKTSSNGGGEKKTQAKTPSNGSGEKKLEEKSKSSTNVAAFPVRKKSSRRGIRLK